MSVFPPALVKEAETLLNALRRDKRTLATAESCTGGLISALLTEVPGSSDVFTHGFVTYANAAKTDTIGVSKTLIANHGAVSSEVAIAMAEGALKAAKADLAVAVTGVAGPAGGTPAKPVGTVHIAVAAKGRTAWHHAYSFTGGRSAIRMASAEAALRLLKQVL